MVAAGCCSASRRTCDTPSSAAWASADSPDGPEPMMAILNMDGRRLAGERLLYPGIGAASKPGSPGGSVIRSGPARPIGPYIHHPASLAPLAREAAADGP